MLTWQTRRKRADRLNISYGGICKNIRPVGATTATAQS
jgi:hypothetical protein